MKLRSILLAAVALTASPAATAPLDDMARDYVALVLEYGEHEEGYVDDYYGPPEWLQAAKANKRSLGRLTADTAALLKRVEASPAEGVDQRRRNYLTSQLRALGARLAMRQGAKFSFADEAEALFGVRPKLKPLSSYDPILARISRLLPGDGPLHERVAEFRKRYEVPKDRLEPVMKAAIAECKVRTAAHLQLPESERFDLEFVKDKPWSGYNSYKGDSQSLIEINTDLPVSIGRAVDLGCHEGYPGHHVHYAFIERNLAKGRGWTEFTVYPLFSPLAFIAEGAASYGIQLAFPGAEQQSFEAKTLYPLAGLNPSSAGALSEVTQAMRALSSAVYTIADDYLAGRISRDQAKALVQRYELMSPEQTELRMKGIEIYRSYLVNYGLGQEMVQAHIERAGPSQAARWKAMERLISEPPVPADLVSDTPSG